MNMKVFVLALTLVSLIETSLSAADMSRYALLAAAPTMEAPRISLIEMSTTGKVKYALITNNPATAKTIPSQNENLIEWVPMSIEALKYDIREVWDDEEVWSYLLADWPTFKALVDIRCREPEEPEVYYFGGLAFSR